MVTRCYDLFDHFHNLHLRLMLSFFKEYSWHTFANDELFIFASSLVWLQVPSLKNSWSFNVNVQQTNVYSFLRPCLIFIVVFIFFPYKSGREFIKKSLATMRLTCLLFYLVCHVIEAHESGKYSPSISLRI